MLFDVRLLAFDQNATGDPVDALVRVFGLDHGAARELMRRLPHVVKRGVSEEGANKLVRALDRIGARTEIVVSTRGPRTPTGTHATGAVRANDTGRLGALPAPSPAARAMIEASAQREPTGASAQREPTGASAQREPTGARATATGSHAHPHARAAHATQHSGRLDPEDAKTMADDDSLEADIETRPSMVEERPTLVTMPRAAPSPVRASLAHVHANAHVPAPVPPQVAAPIMRGAMAHAPRRSLHEPQLFGAQSQAASAVPLPSPSQSTPGVASVFLGMPVALAEPPAAANMQHRAAPSPAALGAQLGPAGARSAATLPVVQQRVALPTLSIHGPSVEASACVMPGTKGAVVVAWVIAVLLSVLLTVLSLGILTVVALVFLFVAGLSRRRTLAAIRASALPVGQSQLPELYACVKQFALRLGLTRAPRMYVVKAQAQGLTALREGNELVLLIDEGTLLRFVEGPKPEALSFLIAHEVARHALGYTGFTRLLLARVSPRLACLDLVSADSAATALVSDHTIVKHALLSLLGVSRLQALLDLDELDRVATSITREPAFWPTRFGADDGFVLSRLYHLQRGYVV